MTRWGSIEERLASRGQREDRGYNHSLQCLVTTGYIDSKGYGRIRGHNGKTSRCHKVAWELYNGPVPEGLELDHLCKQRDCFEVEHLELVTHTENIRRGRNYQREQTHCKRGHEFTPENTYLQTLRTGYIARACKKCMLLRGQKWREEQNDRK